MSLGVDIYRDSKTGILVHVANHASYARNLNRLERKEDVRIFLHGKDITNVARSLDYVTGYALATWIKKKHSHTNTISMSEFLKKGE